MELRFIIFNFFLTGFAADYVNLYPFNKKFDRGQVKSRFPSYDNRNIKRDSFLKLPYCLEPGKCMLLNNTGAAHCYEMKLPYRYTSNSVIHNLTQEEVQFQLQHWKNILIQVPKCWAVVQPFLCALFLPKCVDDMVVVPSKTMCQIIQNPCKIVINYDDWPFNCSSYYKQDKCRNDIIRLDFNRTGQCMSPLVATDDEFNYYEGVEGCGLQCQNPLFTDEERKTIRRIIKIGTIIAFTSNLFAALTFVINWCIKEYRSVLSVFFINLCSLLVSIGYLYQFIPGTTRNVICYEDGILRRSEPKFQKDLLCLTNFVFVYYFFIAGIVWFVIFAYDWNFKLKTIERGIPVVGKVKGKIYYHLVAWSLPYVFTVLIIVMNKVDGDSLLGVCTVGVENKLYRIMFVLGPICCSVVGIGMFFLLSYLQFTSKNVISFQGNSEIISSIIRVLVYSIIMTVCNGVIFTYHIYEYWKDQEWKESLNNYIICGLRRNIENCEMKHRPWMFMVNIYLIALFLGQINMASWIIASTTLNIWTKFIKKIMNRIEELSVFTLNKHQISIHLSDIRKDQVEIYLETSTGMIAAKALLRLITMRNASIRNSADSRICIRLRRYSIDSSISIQTATVSNRSHIKRHDRKEKNFLKSENSSTEIQNSNKAITVEEKDLSSIFLSFSKLEDQVFTELTYMRAPLSPSDFTSNLNRRFAICGIAKSDLRLLNIGQYLLLDKTRLFDNDKSSRAISEEFET